MEIGQRVIVNGTQNAIIFHQAVGIVKTKDAICYGIDFKDDYILHPEHYDSHYGSESLAHHFHICQGTVPSGYGYYCTTNIVHPFQPIRQKNLALYKRSKEKEDEG